MDLEIEEEERKKIKINNRKKTSYILMQIEFSGFLFQKEEHEFSVQKKKKEREFWVSRRRRTVEKKNRVWHI